MCENIIFELGKFVAAHTHVHAGTLKDRAQTTKKMRKTHTDSYVVFCVYDAAVAFLLGCLSVQISLWLLVSSIPLSSTSAILCDGCSQPLKMQEGPNESSREIIFQ